MFWEEGAINMNLCLIWTMKPEPFCPQVDSSLICKVGPLQCCKIAALGNKLAIIKGSYYEIFSQLQFQ